MQHSLCNFEDVGRLTEQHGLGMMRALSTKRTSFKSMTFLATTNLMNIEGAAHRAKWLCSLVSKKEAKPNGACNGKQGDVFMHVSTKRGVKSG